MKHITKRNLGKKGPSVSVMGLGCMRMSNSFGGPVRDEKESIATIHAAFEKGINFLNTADFYGSGHNELLIGRAIKGKRDEAFISVKFGVQINTDGSFNGFDIRPDSIRNYVNYSLVRLGVETIDLYEPARLHPSVPVEEVVGVVSDLVREGKVRYLGLSEVNGTQLRKAHKVHPVTALELEYSLAKRQMETEVLPAARELGVGIVGYANTAQGLLTGSIKAPLSAHDHRRFLPRFQKENLQKNLKKVEVLTAMAEEKGYTPTQLAIAWVLTRGEDIMPLVGISQRLHLTENLKALDVSFTAEELERLNSTFSIGAILGDSYPASH